MMDTYTLYDTLLAKKIRLASEIRKSKSGLRIAEKVIANHEKARIVLTEIAKSTQEEIKGRIEKLVTLAIRSVFKEQDFSFEIRFETKNNRVYAYPVITEFGNEMDPKEDMGGGIIDIISTALRIILWHIESPRKRNVLIFDEPFRFTGKLVGRAGYMIKYLSENLGFQVIMLSHDDELIEFCDRLYKVTRRRDVSQVTLIKSDERKIRRR